MSLIRTPSFWYNSKSGASCLAVALRPASFIYRAASRLHQAAARPYTSTLPVICVGNLVAGGSGKTPAALALMQLLLKDNIAARPCFLTRGYGGNLKGPVVIDTARHDAAATGDEPQLLARTAPVILSADRAAGARLAEQRGHDVIVMDDGLQNPGLKKNLRLVVIDGASGFGNGLVLPAGPLREHLSSGLEKADAYIVIGDDRCGIVSRLPAHKPILHAQLDVPRSWQAVSGISYIAFSGLARPEKFRATAEQKGLTLAGWHSFADHHVFTAAELDMLARAARAAKARLLTTEKDAVRLPADFIKTQPLDILPVQLTWQSPDTVRQLLISCMIKPS